LIGTNSSSATFWFARSLVHNQEECKRSVFSLASTYWFAGANEPGEWKVAAIYTIDSKKARRLISGVDGKTRYMTDPV